jgi:hypothetical protein
VPYLGTNIFPPNEAPYYRKGMWISCGACLLVFFLAILQSLLLWKENQGRDRKYGKQRDTVYLAVQGELGNDKNFRYCYREGQVTCGPVIEKAKIELI